MPAYSTASYSLSVPYLVHMIYNYFVSIGGGGGGGGHLGVSITIPYVIISYSQPECSLLLLKLGIYYVRYLIVHTYVYTGYIPSMCNQPSTTV